MNSFWMYNRARVENMSEEVECSQRRISICEAVTNPYGDDDYMQTKVGIKEKEERELRVLHILQIPQENENPSATSAAAADALPLHSDLFKSLQGRFKREQYSGHEVVDDGCELSLRLPLHNHQSNNVSCTSEITEAVSSYSTRSPSSQELTGINLDLSIALCTA